MVCVLAAGAFAAVIEVGQGRSVGAVPVAGRKMCDGDVYAGSPLRRP